MGKFILLDARLFGVGADLSGASNKIEVAADLEAKDVTNFRSGGYKELLGGAASAEISAEGQWEAGDPGLVDDASWSQLGGVGPWTAGPSGDAVGNVAYLVHALRSSYSLGGGVGDVAPWKGVAKSSWPLVKGQFAHPPGLARTSTGTGTALQLGAVTAGQRLYAALHVLSVAGTAAPTITARVESDDSSAFASPTTRLTFGAAAAPGGQTLRTDGTAVTDAWWRVAWTVTGTTPSFMFVSSLGIR